MSDGGGGNGSGGWDDDPEATDPFGYAGPVGLGTAEVSYGAEGKGVGVEGGGYDIQLPATVSPTTPNAPAAQQIRRGRRWRSLLEETPTITRKSIFGE